MKKTLLTLAALLAAASTPAANLCINARDAISDIGKVRCSDTCLVGLPIDLARHRLNELWIGKIEKNQRRNDGIVIGAITERASPIGTWVSSDNRSNIV